MAVYDVKALKSLSWDKDRRDSCDDVIRAVLEALVSTWHDRVVRIVERARDGVVGRSGISRSALADAIGSAMEVEESIRAYDIDAYGLSVLRILLSGCDGVRAANDAIELHEALVLLRANLSFCDTAVITSTSEFDARVADVASRIGSRPSVALSLADAVVASDRERRLGAWPTSLRRALCDDVAYEDRERLARQRETYVEPTVEDLGLSEGPSGSSDSLVPEPSAEWWQAWSDAVGEWTLADERELRAQALHAMGVDGVEQTIGRACGVVERSRGKSVPLSGDVTWETYIRVGRVCKGLALSEAFMRDCVDAVAVAANELSLDDVRYVMGNLDKFSRIWVDEFAQDASVGALNVIRRLRFSYDVSSSRMAN